MSNTEATVYTTNVDADGSASSSGTSSQGRPFTPDISYEEGNVTYKGLSSTDMVVTPPVPMEWLLEKSTVIRR